MVAVEHQWQKWRMQDWNEALFNHFFLDSDSEDNPVHRLPVTRDELIKVVNDPDADADKVQEAFLSTLRTPSHIEFNKRMRQYPIDPRIGWKGTGIPPFFVELAFSCLVASPPDDEIRSEGDFRKRLALLMDHDQAVAHYPLETLASLWRAFSRWLDTMWAAGSPYRRLELPPQDYRTLIGYSINLAFPSRKDLEKLIRVLSAGGLTSNPPIPTIFALVGEKISIFSRGFGKAYKEFREAYKIGKTALDQYPFWGAIREAIDSGGDAESDEVEDRTSFLLVMEPGGLVCLLSDRPGEVVKDELSFIGFDGDFGEFQNVLSYGRDFEQGILNATIMLLLGRFRNILTGKRWSPIHIAIEQGVLLFAKTERSSWELTFTLQEGGLCRALVKDSLSSLLLSAFQEDKCPQRRTSQYRGWTELDPFPGEWLMSLRYDDRNPLAGIRCLQPTVRQARLSLVGGCQIDGGYLGIPECLPSIRSPLSTNVELVPLEPKMSGDSFHLIRHTSDSVEFAFPSDFKNKLEGRFYFIGRSGDRVLVRKEVVFRPDIVGYDYARPTKPDAWLVEAGGPDVITFGESCSKERDDSYRPREKKVGRYSGGTPAFESSTQFPQGMGTREWSRFPSSISPKFQTYGELEDFGAAGRLMEICGGIAMRRKGIPEWEFLEYLKKALMVDRYRLWDVAYAWVEAGYLDRLMSRNWRRTDYFPRIPRFVLVRNGLQVKGTLLGLATSMLRRRADVELLDRGCTQIKTFSFSEWLPPPPMWVTSDAKAFEEVSRSLALDEPTWVRPITEDLWSLSKIASGNGEPPRFHDCWGCWDWEHGWFAKDTKPTGHGVEVVRSLHIQKPPFYQVLADGGHVWWSTSRNWALLLAHALLGMPCFAFSGADQVVRSTNGQVYLPFPIGRYLAATCPILSGPVSNQPGAYCYQFEDSSEKSRLMAAIWGGNRFPVEELRRWGRWMLDLSRRPPTDFDGRSIPLPKSVKQELDRFPDIREFQELSISSFSPSLLLRLKSGLLRFTKERGN